MKLDTLQVIVDDLYHGDVLKNLGAPPGAQVRIDDVGDIWMWVSGRKPVHAFGPHYDPSFMREYFSEVDQILMRLARRLGEALEDYPLTAAADEMEYLV